MNDLLQKKSAELSALSDGLAKKRASYAQLFKEIALDASHVQSLMQELDRLRRQMPLPTPATAQPGWYDDSPHEGDMGDRRLKISN